MVAASGAGGRVKVCNPAVIRRPRGKPLRSPGSSGSGQKGGELSEYAEFLLKGAAVGFTVSAPLGPIGVLLMRRTLLDGGLAGFAVGLGAVTADVIYAVIAAFGLTAAAGLLVPQQVPLRGLAAAFLLFLAWRAVRGGRQQSDLPTPSGDPEGRSVSIVSAYGTGFVLLITNPAAILIFGAVFAGVGLTAATNRLSALAIVVGVALGASFWWLMLTIGVIFLRGRITARGLRWMNIGSGVLLAVFAAFTLLSP